MRVAAEPPKHWRLLSQDDSIPLSPPGDVFGPAPSVHKISRGDCFPTSPTSFSKVPAGPIEITRDKALPARRTMLCRKFVQSAIERRSRGAVREKPLLR